MTQLDLFGAPAVPATTGGAVLADKKSPKKTGAAQVVEDEDVSMEKMADTEIIIEAPAEPAEQSSAKGPAYPILVEPKPAVDIPFPVDERSVVFENNKISVKIKARQKPDTDSGDVAAKKPAPRRSIVVGHSKNEFSLAMDDKLTQVKNSIKAGLLTDPSLEKKKKQRAEAKPQKRGRKSLKEMDIDADLISIPDDEVLFQKQYYPISEVAGWFRVNTSLLRFWENEFDILKPRKNRKGDRLFRPEDVKNLQLIYQLLRQRKFSIEGAKDYIKSNKNKADTQLHLVNTLQKFRSFLLELKANL